MPDELSGGFDTGYPVGYISGAIGEGWTATEALTTFRADGGTYSTQQWYRLYGETTAAISSSAVAGQLDTSLLPDPNLYSQWAMGPGGQYVTTVNVLFKDADTGIIGSQQYMYKTDLPHAPQDAIDAAEAEFSDPENTAPGGSLAQLSFMGGIVRNIYSTVPFKSS